MGSGGIAALYGIVVVAPAWIILACPPLRRLRDRPGLHRTLYRVAVGWLGALVVASVAITVGLGAAETGYWAAGVMLLGPGATIAALRLLAEHDHLRDRQHAERTAADPVDVSG